MGKTDEKYMRIALEEAKKAFQKGEIPVGAVIVKGEKIIAAAHNTREMENNVLGHAEINAIKKAAESLKNWKLDDCEIYITLEPCPMCAGAIISSRIKRVVFGAYDEKQGCLGSVCDLSAMKFAKTPYIKSGVLKNECESILINFFGHLRKKTIDNCPIM